MDQNGELTQEMLNEEDKYEEEWLVKLNTGGEYTLSKGQAGVIQGAIVRGERGIVMFETFSISLPYVAEFYRVRRFLKDALQLPAKASEKQMTEEDWKEARGKAEEIREKLSFLNKK